MSTGYVGSIAIAVTVGAFLVASGCASTAGVERTRPITLDVTPAGGDAVPAEIRDIGDLKLEVVKAEIVDSVESHVGSSGTTLTAKEGYNLVVVTLTGQITAPCSCTFDTREFAAVCQKQSESGADRPPDTVIKLSDALGREDNWDVPEEGHVIQTGWYFYKPEKLTIRVAFILPKEVTNFAVRCPTTAMHLANLAKP